MRNLIFASSNSHKIREVSEICEPLGIEVSPLPPQLSPPEETGTSFLKNADLKALYYSNFTPFPVLAEDSGLCVESLSGAPGVFSARYAGPGATDLQNNEKLLQALSSFSDNSRRKARFVCLLSLAHKGRILHRARGEVRGMITHTPSGARGFGYDPIFYYSPRKKTFAELEPAEKGTLSHRYRALIKMASWLKTA